MLNSISKRTHNDYVFHANIHGIKMKSIDTIEEPVETKASIEEAAKAKSDMEKLLKVKRAKRG